MLRSLFISLAIITFLTGCNQSELNQITKELDESNKKNQELIEEINEIKKQLNEIQIPEESYNKEISNVVSFVGSNQGMEKLEFDYMGYSTEGGNVEIKLHNSLPIYFSIHFFGEMGQTKNEYYIINFNSVYIKQTNISYSSPLNYDESAEEKIQYYFIVDDIVYETNEYYSEFNEIEKNENILNLIKHKDKISQELSSRLQK
ncbi:hypothetical protein [Chengkuizengella marina]|uniref:Uncharacterized protein n=1 Tax=Chengkuizengella marina TaxID=2507566 RepID=A0A6N9PZJ5_9BACL|nr:hypothetical protein [Chengkuizengella marina]NBI28035.1 hypothetical protein [Chengkuizengella marina]